MRIQRRESQEEVSPLHENELRSIIGGDFLRDDGEAWNEIVLWDLRICRCCLPNRQDPKCLQERFNVSRHEDGRPGASTVGAVRRALELWPGRIKLSIVVP